MIRWSEGVVRRVLDRRAGVLEVEVDTAGVDGAVPALAYLDLVGEPRPGDRCLLNTTAWDRGLGTGGFALVVALPDRLPAPADAGPGHLVKARYTPLQTMVQGADEQESPHHAALRDADVELAGMPVVAADLHSSLPAVVAGVRSVDRALRVAYVMTDGGALPAALSRTAPALREAGWLQAVVTTGQSYGGDLESVTVHTGLLAARYVVDADIAVVVQGPGNLGTGTRWGFSGVAAGEALNAAAVLGGRPVAALRVSGADPRERHRGISHHSATAYGRVLAHPADLVVPVLTGCAGVGDELAEGVRAQAQALAADTPHLRPVQVECAGLDAALTDVPGGLSTMGRGYPQDPAAFLTAAAAGVHAAALVRQRPPGRPRR
ncbi:MAG: DUF3866 family protein [Actinobacteria bacterium]|nr:DUF3866 family protein [Actinomycetota bacterium]